MKQSYLSTVRVIRYFEERLNPPDMKQSTNTRTYETRLHGSAVLNLEQFELYGQILSRVLPEVVHQFHAFGRELVDV